MEQKQSIIKNAFERHSEAVSKSQTLIPEVEKAALVIVEAFKAAGKILICGNGGSAADSQHLAAEWVCKYKKERAALPAIALTVNSSVLTAIGNDYTFDDVFTRQVEALGNHGDVLIAFTTSGGSKNVLNALAAARAKGLKSIAFTGSRGIRLKDLADIVIIVPSEETARVQEVHELAYHAICEFVDEHFA